ncbi:MAG TPA: hypothetical protein VJ761_23645 [Ktedonobacteraceae bacterium]|nr:hypothetical protein [Ktedonobacteraceae bacterium]
MEEQTDPEMQLDGSSAENMGLAEIAEVNIFEQPIEIPEAQSIRALLLIEQYRSLRSEIEKRIDIRQQIMALTLLVAGTFLTVGVQSGVPAVVLLFYPVIAMFLGAIWEHNDLRVGQINFYIRTEVEKHLGALGPGWEAFRAKTFPSRPKQRKLRRSTQRHPLTPQRGLIIFAARGMFFTTQAMALIVAVVRYASEFIQQGFAVNTRGSQPVVISVAIAILFIVDVGILIYTFSIVRHKRT